MRTTLTLIALSSLAVSAVGQDTAQLVSVTEKATSVRALLAKLESTTKVPLVVNPQLAEERLIISVKDRPLKETLDRIAEAVHGSWVPERGGFRLVRTQATQNQLAAEALKLRTAVVRKSIQDQLATAEKNPIRTQAQAKARAEQMAKFRQDLMDQLSKQQGPAFVMNSRLEEPQTPATANLVKLLAAIGPEAIARLSAGQRAVYALTPTRSQLPLPSAAASAVAREFDASQSLYLEALQGLPQDNTPGRAMIFDNTNPETMKTGPTVEILVQIQAYSQGSIGVVVWFVNKDGDVISEGAISVATDPEPTQAPAGVGEGGQPITFSEDAAMHSKLLANSPTGPGRGLRVISRGGETMIAMTAGPSGPPVPRPEISARWRDILSKPNLHEPLSFAASEAVLGIASQLGDNVVANLPDEAIMTFARGGAEPLSPQRFWSALTNNLRVAASRQGGWLVLKPSSPLSTAAGRLNRQAAQAFYGPLANGDPLSLDPLATFIASTTLGYPPPSVSETLGLINPTARGSFEAAVRDAAAYQLYATLSLQDRQRLVAGASVPLQNLSPAQRGLVSSLLFDSPMGPMSRVPRPQGTQESRTVSMRSGGGGVTFGGLGRLSDERTEFLSNGFPMQASFSLKMEQEVAVEASSSTSDDTQMMTAQELRVIRSLGGQRDDGGAVLSIRPPNYDRFRLGTLSRFVVSIQQQDVFEFTRLLDDPKVSGRILGYDELPADFRRKVESSGPPAR